MLKCKPKAPCAASLTPGLLRKCRPLRLLERRVTSADRAKRCTAVWNVVDGPRDGRVHCTADADSELRIERGHDVGHRGAERNGYCLGSRKRGHTQRGQKQSA